MHDGLDRRLQELLIAALPEGGEALEPSDFGWRLGGRFDARLEDGWLCVVSIGHAELPDDDAELLAANVGLAPGVKFARTPEGEVQLRAELRVGARRQLRAARERVGQLLAGLAQARGEGPGPSSGRPAERDAWSQRLADAGWPLAHERADGGIVDLEIGNGGFAQAQVDSTSAGGAALIVALEGAPEEYGRRAQQRFLLRAASWLRGVRPADGDEPTLGWELHPAADRDEIREAFCALSVAYELCAREHRLLGACQRVAHAYLGRSHHTTGRPATRH